MSGTTWRRLNVVRTRFGYNLRKQRFGGVRLASPVCTAVPLAPRRLCLVAFPSGSLSLPVAWAPPGSSLEVQSLRPHPRPLTQNLHFRKIPRGFLPAVKSERCRAGFLVLLSGNHQLVLRISESIFVWFVHSFCSLESTCKRSHMVLVFLCLTYFI